jgi:LemA protein
MPPWIIMAAIVLIVPSIWLLATFNRLIRLRNHCDEAWSNIDTELKRRYNLIPNLVRTVQGYAAHERATLEELTRLRGLCAAENGPPRQQASTENQLVGALRHLMVRVEQYPDLKASGSFLAMQRELAITEDRIQAARRFYNGNVREMNNAAESFPSSLVASAFGFKIREFFEVEDSGVRIAPVLKM